MIDIDRVFPISGIVVEDQPYVHSSTTVKPGYYEAASPVVDPINLECYIHSEEDIPKEEEEEEETEEEEDTNNWNDLLDGWLFN